MVICTELIYTRCINSLSEPVELLKPQVLSPCVTLFFPFTSVQCGRLYPAFLQCHKAAAHLFCHSFTRPNITSHHHDGAFPPLQVDLDAVLHQHTCMNVPRVSAYV